MVQYHASLVFTRAIKGTSRGRIYQELGLESLVNRKWSRKPSFFQKIIMGLLPSSPVSYLNYFGT